MRRFRRIDQGCDEWTGPLTAARWGYPRELSHPEVGVSDWFMYGTDCVIWLEPVTGEPRSAILHVVVAPGTQKHHTGRAALAMIHGIYALAQVEPYAYDRLISNDCTESGEVTDYLKRLGWTPCVMETIEGEWYEKRFTDGDEDSHEQTPETEDCPTV